MTTTYSRADLLDKEKLREALHAAARRVWIANKQDIYDNAELMFAVYRKGSIGSPHTHWRTMARRFDEAFPVKTA